MISRVFEDRAQAGRALARRLEYLRGDRTVVLGLPRGGIPVAFEVARALDAPLDVIVVRKIGVPYQPELAMGAIGEEGVKVLDQRMMANAGVTMAEFDEVEARERAELKRRAELFRGGRPPISLLGKTAVLVDDGIATGSTARAAAQVARALGAARVVVATPVAPPDVVRRLSDDVDEVVIVEMPDRFYAIGQFYDDFTQTPDAEVTRLLELAARRGSPSMERDEDVKVDVGGRILEGRLKLPANWIGVVVFAHGSGSSRHSPRNMAVAQALNRAGIGTLLFDLLTADEELDRRNVFDINLLGGRLAAATEWLLREIPEAEGRVGLFGASTGAAAAIAAAASLGPRVCAIVSRGGRPDLAGEALDRVVAPTLLIVGGADTAVIELNKKALVRLRGESRLEIVPGATHLFEEAGALERVAEFAEHWFTAHFAG
jgi:putative phosphoribosyl transferase